MVKTAFRKVIWLFTRRRKEDELREELAFHLAEAAEEGEHIGLSADEALRTATREFGSVARVAENTRAAWGWTLLEHLGQDLRYGLRTMASNRLFTVLAILSLALGIGANTAIYSFMDAILLRALPVSEPESLVVFNWHARPWAEWNTFVMRGMSGTYYEEKSRVTSGIFPYPAYELFRRYDNVFSSVFAHYASYQARTLDLEVKGQAGVARGEFVSGDFFHGLGVVPAAGRLLLPDDDRPGAPPAAVVSYALSQSRFGGPAQAAGKSVLIDNVPFMVAGVAPPDFFGVDPSAAMDVYLPVHTAEVLGAASPYGFRADRYLETNDYWIEAMARLRPGVNILQAQAALAPAFHQWVATTANERERANLPELSLTPGAGGLDTLRRKYSRPLFVLMTLVGLILALACANVANLLLARATARRREIALRLSVGASRGRVVRQLLTESVLLASLGGILGVFVAVWSIRLLTVLLANDRSNFVLRPDLNWHVLAAASVLALLTGVLFGLAPALEATRVDVMPALKETRTAPAPGMYGTRRFSLSRMLVVGQIAISLLMLVAAGLFVRTLSNLHSVNLGFNQQQLLLFRIAPRMAGHKDPEIAEFYGDLRHKFSRIPGVTSVSLSMDSLIQAGTGMPLAVPGEQPNGDNRLLTVGPDFFSTMRIPMLRGRDFSERDGPTSPAVIVISETFARINFHGRDPMGQHLILRGRNDAVARDMEIIGISKDARYGHLQGRIPPVAYLPYNQGYPWPDRMVFELRTAGDPLSYAGAAREIVRRADARVPFYEVRTQQADIDQTISQEITFAGLCTGFAILALVIACVGLYGTVSYNVARRTGEIGIRMALGAQRGRVMQMILRDVLMMSCVGLGVGLAAALATSHFVASFLFEMKANDPRALAVAIVLLLGAALLAGYIPARRASRIDPVSALRDIG